MQKFIKISNLLIALLIFLINCSREHRNSENLNFDFEIIENGFPIHWRESGDQSFKIRADSIHVYSGKYSLKIENTKNNSGYKALFIVLPHNYIGKIIRFSGYIKTENVIDGYAGLWMRIDPQIGFENMENKGIVGTTDWKKYEITLPLNPKKTDKIFIGAILSGKGKMWLDNLKITIDGKDLNNKNLDTMHVKIDTEFDQKSGVNSPHISTEIIQNLEILGKIWGFIKYNHPEISRGNYNWDYELFRILNPYLKSKSIKERDSILLNWIKRYGKTLITPEETLIAESNTLKKNHGWIGDANISSELKLLLKNIYFNRNRAEKYYVQLNSNIEIPEFKNENPYYHMPYPDVGFRLLALFRYWNIIEYFYPYKHLTDKKWEYVLKQYIPLFLNAENELEYELAVLKLIGEINDTHANLWGGGNKIAELRGKNFAAVKCEFVNDKLIITDYFNPEQKKKTMLKIGDIITHIKGRTVKSIIDSLKPYYPASNRVSMLRDMSEDMLRSNKNNMDITYFSKKKLKTINIPLYDSSKLNIYRWYKVNKNEKCFKILNGNIGYIDLAKIKSGDIYKIRNSMGDTKGIIVDIRNYPSAFVPYELGSYFVDLPTTFAGLTKVDLTNPGKFTITEGDKIIPKYPTYKGKLIILINEKSQSLAEYTAMALKVGKNSTIIGSNSAGADGNVTSIFLPGGISTTISGIGISYPNGIQTQRVGLIPDIEVKPTIDGIKKGKDEVLEKAIEIINQ